MLAAGVPGFRALWGALAVAQAGGRRAGTRGPGRWATAMALAAEIALFLSLVPAVSVPWPAALTLALVVAAILAVILAKDDRRGRRLWPVSAALISALVLDVVVAAFLVMFLFLLMAQGALTGKGIIPFLVLPLVLAFAVLLDVGLPLFLALLLVMTFAAGVLMCTGPLPQLVVPMVLLVGVGVVLFQSLSPGPGRLLRRFPGDVARGS